MHLYKMSFRHFINLASEIDLTSDILQRRVNDLDQDASPLIREFAVEIAPLLPLTGEEVRRYADIFYTNRIRMMTKATDTSLILQKGYTVDERNVIDGIMVDGQKMKLPLTHCIECAANGWYFTTDLDIKSPFKV